MVSVVSVIADENGVRKFILRPVALCYDLEASATLLQEACLVNFSLWLQFDFDYPGGAWIA